MSERSTALDVPQWFAAQVWAGREQLSARHLSVRGYEIFLPCYLEQHRWSDRVKTIERPLFPGYVFCRVAGEVLGRIITSPGVIRIVGDGTRPLPVDEAEMQALQRVIQRGLAAEPWESLRVGEHVTIARGPLSGVEGVVLRMHNRHHLIVGITLLQRAVAVEIDPSWISISSRVWLDRHRHPLAPAAGGTAERQAPCAVSGPSA